MREHREKVYRDRSRAQMPGGHAVIGGFAPHEGCSVLLVTRHGAAGIALPTGDAFECIEHCDEIHETPWASPQALAWVRLRRL